MPGIVTQAVATTVLPYALSSEFVESYDWPIVENGPFPDGSYVRHKQGTASRRGWRLSRRLSSAQFTDLLAFWTARKGTHEAFYFYPVQAQHDATGVSTTGRFLVRFNGALNVTHTMGRDGSDFGLIQLQ